MCYAIHGLGLTLLLDSLGQFCQYPMGRRLAAVDHAGLGHLRLRDQWQLSACPLGTDKLAVLPEGGFDSQQYPRKVVVPVGGGCSGPQGVLQLPVEPLYQPV